jgi:hypothetical protein
MRMTLVRRIVLTLMVWVTLSCGWSWAQSGSCSGLALGPEASLNGFVPFPPNSLWNTNISAMPVDPNSENYINYIGASAPLHPDFGAGLYEGSSIGIPYQVVAKTQPSVRIQLGAYADQSDPGPMPIPPNAQIEGFPKPDSGDRHVLVLERTGCWLYELFNAHRLSGGGWSADSAAVWDMTINEQRPYTWTSADAAGLPIFEGLVRYDEVASGAIHHALRFTVPKTQEAFALPATHWASSITDPDAPPMGTRLRLKASFDISGFPPDDQVILTALKQYGMIVADNGSALFVSGTPDHRWNNDDLDQLKTLTASDFEVVQLGTIYTPENVPQGPSPTINSFTASPNQVNPGTPVTLRWAVSDAIYNIISPFVGPVRGARVTVKPGATTTYTLYSTNRYGRTTATATVTVY